jgi:hypothetical protein
MKTSFIINTAQFKTQKELDGNNFLVAYDVPIAKTGIQQYTREEINDDTGPPDEYVNVYRDQSVFKNKSLVESFDGIPIVYKHPENGKVDNNNFKNFVVGTVSGVYYKSGDLFAKKLTIIDKEAIENVLRKNTNELSIGFKGSVVKKSGTFNGVSYQFKENVIHANHLALCENGKAGSYYAINSIKKKGNKTMEMNNEALGPEEGGLNPHLEGLIEQVVTKKLAAIKPHNFGNDGESEKEEHHHDDESLVCEEESEKEMEHKELKDESDPKLAESEHKDKDLINALRRSNVALKDLIKKKDAEIRRLDLINTELDIAVVEAKNCMQEMSNALKSRKIANSMSGPDNILKPSHPRNIDMSNSITSSFLIK